MSRVVFSLTSQQADELRRAERRQPLEGLALYGIEARTRLILQSRGLLDRGSMLTPPGRAALALLDALATWNKARRGGN